MRRSPGFPLWLKVLGWLCLHLIILGLSFFIFVRWQLGLGLDSLISGSAGDRLASFGDSVVSRIVDTPPREWNERIRPVAEERGLVAAIFEPNNADSFPLAIPPNVVERARGAIPPQRAEPGSPVAGRGRPRRPGRDPLEGRRPPRPDRFEDDGPPPPEDELLPPEGEASGDGLGSPSVFLPKCRPVFLMKGEHGGGYWAGVLLHLPPTQIGPRRPVMLLLRAEHLNGAGLFFDYKPWLWGGIAVLALTIAFWAPFVWGLTRYIRKLKSAADEIAAGRFQVSLPHRGGDELGELGRSIESMAARLDHLVAGQKRFLGDAAHELCAPLARIRTGLGILEMKLQGDDSAALSSIEADTSELASLVNEILAFSRAGNRAASLRRIPLEPLVRQTLARESLEVEAAVVIPENLAVTADAALLGRAIGNLVRNAAVHAGPGAKVSIAAVESSESVRISVSDNGPGVPESEIPRIFEPFYRLDRSRSRDTGGSGLGLSIVRAAIETCGGAVGASLPPSGGLCVTLTLPLRAEATPAGAISE